MPKWIATGVLLALLVGGIIAFIALRNNSEIAKTPSQSTADSTSASTAPSPTLPSKTTKPTVAPTTKPKDPDPPGSNIPPKRPDDPANDPDYARNRENYRAKWLTGVRGIWNKFGEDQNRKKAVTQLEPLVKEMRSFSNQPSYRGDTQLVQKEKQCLEPVSQLLLH